MQGTYNHTWNEPCFYGIQFYSCSLFTIHGTRDVISHEMFSVCILVLPEERTQRPVKQFSGVPSCCALQIWGWYQFYYYYYYFIAVVKITIAVIVIITLSSRRRLRLLVVVVVIIIIIIIIAFTPRYRISFPYAWVTYFLWRSSLSNVLEIKLYKKSVSSSKCVLLKTAAFL